MTKYEEHFQKMQDKYGIPGGRLQTEPEKRAIELPTQADTAPSRIYTDYLDGLKNKYGLPPEGLKFDGIATQEQKTVQDFVTEKERDAMKGMKLSYGSTSYKGRPLKVWFEISK